MKQCLAARERGLQGSDISQVPDHRFHRQACKIAATRLGAQQYAHLVPGRQQRSYHRGADEAAAASHQRLHARCAPMARNARIAIR